MIQLHSVFLFYLSVGYVTCLLCSVALQRPTTSTSFYSYNSTLDGNPCNAVDGWNATNFYSGSCYHSLKDDLHPSVTVDLGDIYDIQNVGFALREDNWQFEHYKKLSNFKIYVGNETNNQSEVCAVYPGVPTEDDIGWGILVNCSALARYVMVKKSSADLQFCEMTVIANIPSSLSCPKPLQSWHCRDLCYGVSGSNNCSQNSSIESTTNDVSPEPTIIIVSFEQTTHDTSPEPMLREVSKELVTIEVSAVTPAVSTITLGVSAITPEASTVINEASAVTPEASTVTPEASTVTPEVSAVINEVSAVTPEASTVKNEVSAVTPEASTVKNEVSAVTPEASTVKNEVSAVTPEVSTVINEVSAVTARSISGYHWSISGSN